MSVRGHRAVPHTADVGLEAWGPDLPACFEEAVAALVDVYLDDVPAPTSTVTVAITAGAPDEMLLALLDEVILALDTSPGVPVGASVTRSGDGGLDVTVSLADRKGAEGTGAVPKAISHSGLDVEVTPSGARCRFLVDI